MCNCLLVTRGPERFFEANVRNSNQRRFVIGFTARKWSYTSTKLFVMSGDESGWIPEIDVFLDFRFFVKEVFEDLKPPIFVAAMITNNYLRGWQANQLIRNVSAIAWWSESPNLFFAKFEATKFQVYVNRRSMKRMPQCRTMLDPSLCCKKSFQKLGKHVYLAIYFDVGRNRPQKCRQSPGDFLHYHRRHSLVAYWWLFRPSRNSGSFFIHGSIQWVPKFRHIFGKLCLTL